MSQLCGLRFPAVRVSHRHRCRVTSMPAIAALHLPQEVVAELFLRGGNQEVMLGGIGHCLQASMDIQLREDVLDMLSCCG